MDISNNDLISKLQDIAILEGGMTIDDNGYLFDIINALNIKEEFILTNIYREHNKLLVLPQNNISTILMETTFTYQDKIYDVAKFIIDMYKKTGWKPKNVINTMDYGLNALYYICSKLDIDVYKIDDADDIVKYDFSLTKIELSKEELIMTSMRYDYFDELFNDMDIKES